MNGKPTIGIETEKPVFDIDEISNILVDILNRRNDGRVYTAHLTPEKNEGIVQDTA